MSAHALVVLPFENTSGDAARDDIALAVTTDLTRGLSSIKDSLVIAESSARALAPQARGVAEIGRLLGVGFVLSGQASLNGQRLRISATLVRAEDQEKVWSDAVEGDFVALRDLEGKIVAGIAKGLNVALVDGGRQAATPEPAALESLLRAKALANKPTSAQMIAEAARLYTAAVNDPAIGPEAKAGLAAIHLALALSSGGKPAAFAAHELQESERLLEEALAAEPKNSSANNTLGALRRATGKPREALAAYEAAIAADRNDANAHAQIGRLMIELGDAEHAFGHIKLALRLSPLDAQRPLWFTFAGLARLQIGEAQEARGWLEKAVAAAPQFVTAVVFLAAAQQLTGDAEDARRTMASARQMTPSLSLARVEQGFAPIDRADPGWLRIRDSLRATGLPD